jgi:hypothetical protein
MGATLLSLTTVEAIAPLLLGITPILLLSAKQHEKLGIPGGCCSNGSGSPCKDGGDKREDREAGTVGEEKAQSQPQLPTQSRSPSSMTNH